MASRRGEGDRAPLAAAGVSDAAIDADAAWDAAAGTVGRGALPLPAAAQPPAPGSATPSRLPPSRAATRNAAAAAAIAAATSRFTFKPCVLENVPEPTLAEYRTIFDDIDLDKAGSVARGDLSAALRVNGIRVDAREWAAVEAAMDPDRTGRITFPRFAAAIYAFSLSHRDVLAPGAYSVFPDSEFTAETATGMLKLRRDIWLLLEDPISSLTARLVSVLIVAAILLSTISFCVETLPGYHNRQTATFDAIELLCIMFFTLEFALRLSCTPEPRKFFSRTLNVIDLLAIIPFYVELMLADSDLSGSALLRAVRLIRVFRLLKVGRYLRWMQVFGRTLTASVAPLLMLVFIIR
jgi:hypothetical protein